MPAMPINVSISPLAPKAFAKLAQLPDVRLAVAATGQPYRGRDDLLVVQLPPTARVAGVFTSSKTASAPVDLCRAHLQAGRGRIGALLVNAGNANAFSGAAGMRVAQAIARAAAKKFGTPMEHVFVASTGVIGEVPDAAPLLDGLEKGEPEASDSALWQASARAMMTTDTFPKMATRTVKFGQHKIKLNGIAKGSGMIAPDMATMLAFIFTDAAIPTPLLQKLLLETTARSFNCITVDSDTSTSDTCLLIATGENKITGGALRAVSDKRLRPFRKALLELMQELAIQVVSDGEGITKLMTIDISGAADDASARRIGLSVGNSPLVKTAIAGADANWGRIVMAVGKSGELVERDRLAITLGGHKVAYRGRAVPHFDEAPVAAHLKKPQVHIGIHVGALAGKGKGKARVWASDLTHGYIQINADYRS